MEPPQSLAHHNVPELLQRRGGGAEILGCSHNNWQQFGKVHPAASHVEVNSGSPCSVWRPLTTQTNHAQHWTTYHHRISCLKLSQNFSGYHRPHTHWLQSQTFNEGWKATELIWSWGQKARDGAADGCAGPRGEKVVRGDSGTPRSAQAARSGNPGGVAAEEERGRRHRFGGFAATSGHPDGRSWGPPRAPYP